MRCDRWTEAMSARLDGEAEPAESAALDDHLAGCVACRERLTTLERQHRRLRLHEAPVVPDIVGALLDRPRGGRSGHRWFPLTAAATFAAASVALSVVTITWDQHAAGAEPLVASAVVRPTALGGSAVVYLSMVNDGGADTVTGGWSPIAERVAFHHSKGHAGEAVMSPVSSVAVPAKAPSAFLSSDTHVMLEGLRVALRPGDRVSMRLEFARSGPVFVTATVEA